MKENSHFIDIHIMRHLEQEIIYAQSSQGSWLDSVSTTCMAIVALSDYALTPEASFAVRKGGEWVFTMQGPDGVWGRYRYRTKLEEVIEEMDFDPDWPHTVFALWFQIHLGFVRDSIPKGVEWLCERYQSERYRGSLAPELDLMTITEMIKHSSHREHSKIFEQVSLSKWKDMEQAILQRKALSLSELHSLYRYIKYLCSIQNVNIFSREVLASHIEQGCSPLVKPTRGHSGILNYQITALRILLSLYPEEYYARAERFVSELLNTGAFHIIDKINLYDTVGLILLQKKFMGSKNRLVSSPVEGNDEITKDINMANKTKILFLSANPSGSLLNLGEEIKRIQIDLKMAKERNNLELKQYWAITIDTLMQAILDEIPNIVHFSGHGQQEGIILQNEIGEPKLVSAESLKSLFRLFNDTVVCVVLNSCYSEEQAKAIKLHIPHVIGMKSGIPDKAAISFSTGFYKAIGAGRDIPFAFEFGVTAIKLEGVSGENVPILL